MRGSQSEGGSLRPAGFQPSEKWKPSLQGETLDPPLKELLTVTEDT